MDGWRTMADVDLSRRNLVLASAILSGVCGARALPALAAAPEARKAAQAPLRLLGRTCALVVIDLQVGNAHAPFTPHGFSDVVRNSNVVAVALRSRGGLVARTRTLETEMLHLPADEPLPSAPPIADAAEFASGANPEPGDVVITKRQWGAFYATDLDQQLRRRRIDTLLIAGVATELGVESTVRAAYDRGYGLVFVEDAISGTNRKSNDFFVGELFPRMGRVCSSAEIAIALTAT